MSKAFTIKSESEDPARHEPTNQDITKAQRAYLEHIAKATLALMREPIQDQPANAAELQHAHSLPAISAVFTKTDDLDPTGKSMKTENGGVELPQDKKEECAGKVEDVEEHADVRRLESCKDSGSPGENVATRTRWLRLLGKQQDCSRVADNIEKSAENKHFESSEEVGFGGDSNEGVITSNHWLRLL